MAKFEVPKLVGVPLIVPCEVLKASPLGSVPEATLHVYGVVPPTASSVTLYGVPCNPFGNELFSSASGEIETVYLAVADTVGLSESVAWMVNVNIPPPDGLPVMAPVLVFRVNEGGNAPERRAHV
jgi:hypothetical protein